jgi:hypothetical protein
MAAFGTLQAKVLIQVGEGEPIEVGTMDIDLVAKQQPVKRGDTTVNMTVHTTLDAEATAQQVARRLSALAL